MLPRLMWIYERISPKSFTDIYYTKIGADFVALYIEKRDVKYIFTKGAYENYSYILLDGW